MVDVANSGEVACTVLRVGFSHGHRLLRQEKLLIGTAWTYGGPTADSNGQRHPLKEYDAAAWNVSRMALPDALGRAHPAAVCALVQLGDGRLLPSERLSIR